MRAVAILPENDEGLKDIVKKLSNVALVAVVFLATSTVSPPKMAPSTLKELTHKGLVIVKSDKVFLTPDGTKIASKYKLESDQQGTNMTKSRADALNEKLSQYQQQGDQFRVAHETTEKLLPGIYRIKADMQGIYFETATMSTDSILKARDERLDSIIEEAASFWALKDKYARLGLNHKRGILLESAPGTGKSILMQRLAEDATTKGAIVFLSTDPELLKAGLHQIKAVESDRDIMVLMDDFDRHFSYGEGTLISLLDGEDSVSNILFVAATNYVERMSPRLRRPGRFDTLVSVKNPPATVREAYFMDKIPKADAKKIATLVKATDDFSFAEMKEMVVSTEIYDRDIAGEAARIKSTSQTKAEALGEGMELSRADKLIDEIAKVKAIRGGKVVKIMPPKPGYKIVGNKYVKITGAEKTMRSRAAKKAAKKGKAKRARSQKISQKIRKRRGL